MHDFPPYVPPFGASAAADRPPAGSPTPGADTGSDRPTSGRSRRGRPGQARSGQGRSGQRRRPRWSSDFSDPDTRTPSSFLFWLIWQQRPALLLSSFIGVLEWLPGSVGPFFIGLIIDHGIARGNFSYVVRLSVVMLVLSLVGIVAALVRHNLIVRGWLVTMFAAMKLVTRKTTQLGHLLPQRTPTGEVLSVSSGDTDQFGGFTEVGTRALGALTAYLIVAGLVLSTSLKLGLVVLIAAPLLVLAALPLLRPMQRRQQVERSRSSELTSLATDIVAGLRILRGIGGERTFATNYELQSQRTKDAGINAGRWQALIDSASLLFSGLFLVALTWLGAREVVAGRLSVGQLVSFFGYAVFMVWPIQTFFELTERWVRALVSARKAIAVLGQQPPWTEPVEPLRLPMGAPLHDERSGFTALPGRLTMVVCGVPDEAAALADRLGRYLPADHEPVALDVDEAIKGRAARIERSKQQAERERLAARDRELARQNWGVSVGSVDLTDVPLAEVRELIMVTDTKSQLFAGTLQEAVDPHGRLTREQAEVALHVAAAEDVFETFSDGWQAVLDERGRGLSGGQRQRIVLARAIAQDPEILVLVEPTSAVDAHTEAAIAGRLSAHREGRTTVIMSASPLLLHYADEVALLDDGRIVSVGRHTDLLATDPAYRLVVARTMEEIDV